MHLTGLVGRVAFRPCTANQIDRRSDASLRPSQPSLHTLCTSVCVAKHAKRATLLCRANGDTLQATSDPSKRSIDLEHQAEGEYCMPGEVTFDNEAHEQFTLMKVEVKDYPGLLRVIAWVLNGLQLVVQNARYLPTNRCVSVGMSATIECHLSLAG